MVAVSRCKVSTTADEMAENAVCSEPVSGPNPRSAGKIQGIPLKSGRRLRVSGGNRAGLQHSQPRFPYSAEQGMIDRGTRMFRTGVGKPTRGVCRSAARQAASRQLLETPRAATLGLPRGA